MSDFVSENKVFSGVMVVVLSLLISWGVWVTVSVFRLERCISEAAVSDVVVGKKLDSLQSQITDNRLISSERDDRIYDKLLEIHKDVAKIVARSK